MTSGDGGAEKGDGVVDVGGMGGDVDVLGFDFFGYWAMM